MTKIFERSNFLILYTNDHERRARRRSRMQPMALQRTYNIMAMQGWVMFGCWLVGMLEWATLAAESAFNNAVFVAVMVTVFMCLTLVEVKNVRYVLCRFSAFRSQ